jgi:hypothetical protein
MKSGRKQTRSYTRPRESIVASLSFLTFFYYSAFCIQHFAIAASEEQSDSAPPNIHPANLTFLLIQHQRIAATSGSKNICSQYIQ